MARRNAAAEFPEPEMLACPPNTTAARGADTAVHAAAGWGLLRLDLAAGRAAFGPRALPLPPDDVALLGALLAAPGDFLPAAQLLASRDDACPRRLRDAVGRINTVLAAHRCHGYHVLEVPGAGFGLALPGLRPHGRAAGPAANPAGLPPLRARTIGQEANIERLAARLPPARLLSIVGAGGIGKTTLAVEVARRLADRYRDGICFFDLAPLTRAEAVPAAVATRLQMPALPQPGASDIVDFLQTRQMLLVLDNCEHVLDVAAGLAQQIVRGCAQVHLLVTSREPLRCAGESVHRMRALPTPLPAAAQAALSAQAAMDFAAVRLFVERVADALPGFALDDAQAPLAAAICRHADGLPLAIELVAAQARHMSLPALAEQLRSGPLALQNPRRTAVGRHRSLQQLLAWSHALLTPHEQRVLRRLALFRARFELAGAAAVAGDDGEDPGAVGMALVSLAAKSLLVMEPGPDGPRCHLLETTRSFAHEALARSGELAATARRHAQSLCSRFREAQARWPGMTREAWLQAYGPSIDDVRSALDWSFSPEGDPEVGLTLAIDSVQLAYQLSLWDEYGRIHGRAIACMERMARIDPATEMKLRLGFGSFLGQTIGPVPQMNESYRAALQATTREGAAHLRADALDGVWMGAFLSGDYPGAMRLAQQCSAIERAPADVSAPVRTARMLAQSLHFMAQHAAANEQAQALLQRAPTALRRLGESSIDPRVSVRVVQARSLWLLGRPDQAAATIERAVALAEQDMSAALAHALAWGALPIALWRGDTARAGALLERLVAHCSAHHLPYWASWQHCYRLAERAPPSEGATHELPLRGDLMQLDTLLTFAPQWLSPPLLARAEAGQSPWCQPEVLRIRGEQLLTQAAPAADGGAPRTAQAAAARLFARALRLALAQQALGWALRSALSLARLRVAQHRAGAAAALLRPLLARFQEGAGTADLRAAHALLAQLDA